MGNDGKVTRLADARRKKAPERLRWRIVRVARNAENAMRLIIDDFEDTPAFRDALAADLRHAADMIDGKVPTETEGWTGNAEA